MQLNQFSKISLLIAIFFSSISIGFSANIPANLTDPVVVQDNLLGNSQPNISESADGFTYKIFGNNDPLNQSTVSNIIDSDGNPAGRVIRTLGSNGETIVKVTDVNGNVTLARSEPDGTWSGDPSAVAAGKSIGSASVQNTIYTTEKIPGGNCVCAKDADCTNKLTQKFVCTPKLGLTGFQEVFKDIVRYVVNIVLLTGVLAVVGLGIAWSFAGGDDIKMKSTLKKWAMNIIIGFVILFMFGYILRLLAPWVYV